MDNFNNHINVAQTVPDSVLQSEYQNRQRENPQKPYGDLREFLNKKRQTKDEPKFNGPPSEPKYNFLSDPLRDGEENPEHYVSRRFIPRNNSEHRGRPWGSGRGRGRVYYQSNNNYRPNYKRSEEIKGDQNNLAAFDELEHKSEDRKKDKYTANEEHSKYKTNSQFRPFVHRPNYQRRRYDQGNKFENSNFPIDQYETGENSRRPEENNRGYYKPRKNFPSRGNQHYRPPYRYNPNFKGQNKRYSKPLDPVNITVEYFVDSGIRKCTIENIEKKDFAIEESNSEQEQKCTEVYCEENWDTDAYGNEPYNENEELHVTLSEKQQPEKEKPNKIEEGEPEIDEAGKENVCAVEEEQEIDKTEEKKGNTADAKEKIVKTKEENINTEETDKIREEKVNPVQVIEAIIKTNEETVSAVDKKQEIDKMEKKKAKQKISKTKEENSSTKEKQDPYKIKDEVNPLEVKEPIAKAEEKTESVVEVKQKNKIADEKVNTEEEKEDID